MRKYLFSLVALCLVLLPLSRASGWFETGHRETALIAWDDLTPATRAKITEILKQHPRYTQDLLANVPANSDDQAISRFAFSSSAAWPDMVKDIGNPMHATHNHPAWHYIDIPYAIDGQPATTKPSRETGPKNIVEALAKNVTDLKDPSVSGADKAVALCWVVHLCGDIHQPLHACTFFSAQFPKSDEGGNMFMVMRLPPYPNTINNLHLIWDAMPGDFESQEFDAYTARGMKEDPRLSRENLKDALAVKDFAAWANESHSLAVEYVYLNGKLEGVVRGAPEKPHVPGLPAGYIRKAEEISARQIVLAGYRMADLLNSIFDAKPATNPEQR